MPCFFSSSSSFFRSVWNSLAAEASAGRCSLTQRVKSIAAAGGRKLGLLLRTEWLKKKKYDCFMRACRRERNSCVVFNTLKSPSIPRPVNH